MGFLSPCRDRLNGPVAARPGAFTLSAVWAQWARHPPFRPPDGVRRVHRGHARGRSNRSLCTCGAVAPPQQWGPSQPASAAGAAPCPAPGGALVVFFRSYAGRNSGVVTRPRPCVLGRHAPPASDAIARGERLALALGTDRRQTNGASRARGSAIRVRGVSMDGTCGLAAHALAVRHASLPAIRAHVPRVVLAGARALSLAPRACRCPPPRARICNANECGGSACLTESGFID